MIQAVVCHCSVVELAFLGTSNIAVIPPGPSEHSALNVELQTELSYHFREWLPPPSSSGRQSPVYWFVVTLPTFQPLPLTRRPTPFSHPDWLFEVKYDGFRPLAYAGPSGVRLLSRKGNRFSSFSELCAGIEFSLYARHAILDGEIVCLDESGCSQFNQLLFRRGTPTFCAFDLLNVDGKDLRALPLNERKCALRKVLPDSSFLLYVDHIEGEGERMFQLACERDLEGIVAKHRLSRYVVEDGNPAWVKIRNRRYSLLTGRDELFERRYEERGAPEIGWDTCAKVSVAAAI
jgi:bifunctional non-homologous end joining protein LigD